MSFKKGGYCLCGCRAEIVNKVRQALQVFPGMQAVQNNPCNRFVVRCRVPETGNQDLVLLQEGAKIFSVRAKDRIMIKEVEHLRPFKPLPEVVDI